MGRRSSDPADTFAQIPSSFGPSRAGSELEPGQGQHQFRLVGLGTGLEKTLFCEGFGLLEQLRQPMAVGVDLLELELVAIEVDQRQPGIEPA